MKKLVGTSLVVSALTVSVMAQTAMADVNVYSSRQEALIKPLLGRFTEQTGIEVKLVSGKDDALITRLTNEGYRSPADLLITADAGRLHRATEAELFQPLNSDIVNAKVPASLRDVNDYWTGLTLRARPIFYVKGAVDSSELSSYEALTGEEFEGRICIRSSSNIYNQSLIASMIEVEGTQATEDFANGLVANFARPPAGGDTDQLRAAAAGLCDIAIANTYYFGRLMNSDKAEDQEVVNALGVFWPNQEGRGTHVNVSGIGLTKASKNKEEAIQLVEYMLSDEAQQWYASVNNEYPVVADVSISGALESLGEFKADSVNLSVLGERNREAVELMDRAGWK